MSTETNDPATQARIAEALGALAGVIDRSEAAGAPPSEIVAMLLLTAAHGAYSHGATGEQFEELARRAWAEMRCARGAR